VYCARAASASAETRPGAQLTLESLGPNNAREPLAAVRALVKVSIDGLELVIVQALAPEFAINQFCAQN